MKLYELTSEYTPLLDLKQTELAIKQIKEVFQLNLSSSLRLRRVTAPVFVLQGTGLNDDLNVDQWDWERVISESERSVEFLKMIVNEIYSAILHTEFTINETYPQLKPSLPEKVTFIHSEELRLRYPHLTAKQREEKFTQENGAVFIIGIGEKLGDGIPHDNRAPDYDDYSTPNEDGFKGLNGDLLIWSDLLGKAVELSSMGIRVDREALLRQLKESGKEERKELYFHRRLLAGELPLCIGGGIGQSRLCMLLLKKAHIGEIQSSIWPLEMREQCRQMNIPLI